MTDEPFPELSEAMFKEMVTVIETKYTTLGEDQLLEDFLAYMKTDDWSLLYTDPAWIHRYQEGTENPKVGGILL